MTGSISLRHRRGVSVSDSLDGHAGEIVADVEDVDAASSRGGEGDLGLLGEADEAAKEAVVVAPAGLGDREV